MLKYLIASSTKVRAQETPKEAVSFSYHQKTGIQALLSGLLMAALVEAVVLHILIALWNHWVALLATLSTVWVALQILAQIRVVGMRPIYIAGDEIVLRNGAFDIARLPIQNISQLEITPRTDASSPDGLKPLHVTFPANSNIRIQLAKPMTATILNRQRREVDCVLLALDQPNEFADYLRPKLEAQNRDTELSDAR